MLFSTYNIHYGVGADGRYDVARIADAVDEADIVCIQEAAAGWHLNDHADQTAEIAQRLNRYHWYHGAMEADASEVGAGGRIVNRRRSFGNAIVSRWPITWARGHLLPKTRLVASFDLQRGFVSEACQRFGERQRFRTACGQDNGNDLFAFAHPVAAAGYKKEAANSSGRRDARCTASRARERSFRLATALQSQ